MHYFCGRYICVCFDFWYQNGNMNDVTIFSTRQFCQFARETNFEKSHFQCWMYSFFNDLIWCKKFLTKRSCFLCLKIYTHVLIFASSKTWNIALNSSNKEQVYHISLNQYPYTELFNFVDFLLVFQFLFYMFHHMWSCRLKFVI